MESCGSVVNIEGKRTSLGPLKRSSNVTPNAKIKELKQVQRKIKRDK